MVACGLALGAFTMGAALGDGDRGRPSGDLGRSSDDRGGPSGPLGRLSDEQLAGTRIVIGFLGRRPPDEVRRQIAAGHAAGVVLYAENMAGRAKSRRMIRSLQSIPRPPGLRDPLLVMIDQEGGLVKRIGGAPAGSAREMAARGPAYARRQGRRTAANMRDLGANMNLAPVLDVARPGSAMTETAREWGFTPRRVSAGAIPFALGLQAGGVAATAKHFPGLGAVRGDTDLGLRRIGLSKRVIRRVDEAPFRRFAQAGGKVVMVSEGIYPSFSGKPAAFARPIVTGELRRRVGFRGVILTDSLNNASALEFGGTPLRAGLAAVRAGADLLLFKSPEAGAETRRALARRLRSGALDRDAFERSAMRVQRLRRWIARAGSG